MSMSIRAYRTYKLEFKETGPFTIGAMARPGHQEDYQVISNKSKQILDSLCHDKKHTSLLSLKEPYHDTFTNGAADYITKSKLPLGYTTHNFKDFSVPDIESFDAFREEILSQIQEHGNRPLIHCGAGFGRSGTMIASLFLYQLIQETPIDQLDSLLTDTPYKKRLSGYDDSFQPSTPRYFISAVVKSLDFAKSAEIPDAKNSVETEAQARGLEKYAKVLIERKKEMTKEINSDEKIHTTPLSESVTHSGTEEVNTEKIVHTTPPSEKEVESLSLVTHSSTEEASVEPIHTKHSSKKGTKKSLTFFQKLKQWIYRIFIYPFTILSSTITKKGKSDSTPSESVSKMPMHTKKTTTPKKSAASKKSHKIVYVDGKAKTVELKKPSAGSNKYY